MYPLVFLFEERQRSSFQRRPLSASRKCKFACSLNANIVLRTKAPVNIMYASTRDVGGTARGQMIIQLPDNEEQKKEILQYLHFAQIPYEEVDSIPSVRKEAQKDEL